MNATLKPDEVIEQRKASQLLDVLIRAGLILVLVMLCYRIFSPFLTLMVWALILAVAMFPMHQWLARRLGGGPTGIRAVDRLLGLAERLGFPFSPRPSLDFLLRTGAFGDRYLPWRRGLRLADVDAAEHGIDLGPLAEGVAHRVFHRGGRIALAPQPLM